MKLKRLAISMMSAGLLMSLGTGTLMVKADENISDKATSRATAEFKGGSLEFASIDQFVFGTQMITDSTNDYIFSLNADYTLSVRDLRGNGEGWRVDAKLSEFTNTENKKESLQSAELMMKKGAAVKRDDSADENRPVINDGNEIILQSGADSGSQIAKAMGSENYLDAEGVGLWDLVWASKGEDSGVELVIPARSASTGNHAASVNWTLTSDMTTK